MVCRSPDLRLVSSHHLLHESPVMIREIPFAQLALLALGVAATAALVGFRVGPDLFRRPPPLLGVVESDLVGVCVPAGFGLFRPPSCLLGPRLWSRVAVSRNSSRSSSAVCTYSFRYRISIASGAPPVAISASCVEGRCVR